MLAQIKMWLAAAGVVVLLLAGSNAWTYWRTDAAAYARGARDQKLVAQAETAMLNARLRDAEAATREAANSAADARRQLLNVQMENARERSRDPAAAGSGLPPGELRRVFRVTGTGYD